MKQADHSARCEEWLRSHSGNCPCGGAIRTGQTVQRFAAVSFGVWESLLWANCDRCGAGQLASVTAPEEDPWSKGKF